MDIEDLDLACKYHKLPSRAFYLAGIVKIESELSVGVILEFFDIIYSESIPLDCLKNIEEQLYLGKIGTAKEILRSVVKKCFVCNKSIKKTQRLGCGHFFHRECLKDSLTRQISNDDKIGCPNCQKDIEEFSGLDEDLAMMINDFYLAKSLLGRNFQYCPCCKNVFEIEDQGIIACPYCFSNFCSFCSEKEDGCLCQKFCQKCNGIYVGKQCYECFGD
ncbi:hypothetical protein SteCoe_33603 [Stentor coeruleus]|uniref:RING-type domain-containing protein n=1 Tax=Stentor coeruleus TaxID=5963 RepID=A0A1R2AWE1_9CILI|nr:hypothetical protein SteCoe_33603 [Stentor coeruleus]